MRNREFLTEAITDMLGLVSLKDLQKIYWIVVSFAKKKKE